MSLAKAALSVRLDGIGSDIPGRPALSSFSGSYSLCLSSSIIHEFLVQELGCRCMI